MIYKTKVQIPATEKILEHYVASCVDCGNDDIQIDEYEDNFGFISTATCKKCKKEIRKNVSETGVIAEWNKNNDIPTLIEIKSALIVKLKDEIKTLKMKQKLREKNKKTNN